MNEIETQKNPKKQKNKRIQKEKGETEAIMKG